ncbi:GNAT family N-acetyltransferase [Rhizobium helianthi]|uniref:GNAT family N-acetyltransferase n=1 Tax=Rhizobium helianthi TaxID=1132695 RepID=A0ABW4M454_9HYPH
MKSTDLVIRPYDAAADLTRLSAIWLSASRIAHPFIGEQQLQEQQVLVETLYLPTAETWVASMTGEAVGFISLLDQFIGGLFIEPCRQGEGIGRALVQHALARKGDLSLDVYTQNRQAFGFYLKLGFQEVSRRSADDQGLPFENARLLLKA